MNAAEHIVEAYFRLCRNCFTRADVKVYRANNRQLDLLAVDLEKGLQYHVETSVTLGTAYFAYHTTDLAQYFNHKFRGIPKKQHVKDGGLTQEGQYEKQIHETYESVGFDPQKVQRVWCCWMVADAGNLEQFLTDYKQQAGLHVEILKLRDTVLPDLLNKVKESNYDDDVLRILSLLKARDEHEK